MKEWATLVKKKRKNIRNNGVHCFANKNITIVVKMRKFVECLM